MTPPDTPEPVTNAELSEDPPRRRGLAGDLPLHAANVGQAQAVLYVRGLEQRFTALAANPLTGIAREDVRPEGLRSIAHGSHVVFYQPQPYGVLIVRVLHGRQDVRTHPGSGEGP